jgi:hypothetical protein
MDKQKAIARIENQISQIDEIASMPRFSPEFKKWKRDTEVAIERIFGEETRHVKDFADIRYNLGMFTNLTPDSAFDERFREGLQNARQILYSFIEEIKEYWDDEPQPASRNAIATIENICHRFHAVVRRMRQRYNNRDTLNVEDEYDVQDLLHAVLALEFDDIRPEEWTPSYAGSSSRTDFLLKQEQIVIEVKKTRQGLTAKQLGEELMIDIQRYHSHPDCQTLICFVYDPEGRIANPRGLENDLNRVHEGMDVKVIITPR